VLGRTLEDPPAEEFDWAPGWEYVIYEGPPACAVHGGPSSAQVTVSVSCIR